MPRAALLPGLAALLLVLGPAGARGGEVPSPVTVAVADFQVQGLGEPRYWLGPVYTEVLQRRLSLCAGLLVREGLEARMQTPPPRLEDVPALKDYLLRLCGALECKYAVGGLIQDKGATVVVTCVVAWRDRKSHWALPQEAPFEQVFQPQVELVVKRFLTNMGVRASAAETAAMAAYEPGAPMDQLQKVGEGWRSYTPEEPGRSLEIWRRVLDDHPNCAYAAEAEASVSHFYRRLLYERSLSYYENLVGTTDPDNPTAHYRLAELYADGARWGEAEVQYLRALNLRATYLDAYMGLGRVRMEMGLWQPALQAYDAALTLSPDNCKALLNRGVVLYRRGMIPEALETWAKVLKIDPDNAVAKKYIATYGRGTPGLP